MAFSEPYSYVQMFIEKITERDEFIEHLDGRQDNKTTPLGLVAKKVRRIGEPSQTQPPIDAPGWAIRNAGIRICLPFILQHCVNYLLIP